MIKVLIVDDSALVRKILTTELSKFSDIEIVGTAIDPYVARDKILALKPDVMTLDIEMPRMDGLSFLEKIMKYHPMPVVIVSSLTPRNSEMAIRALELGALDVVCKPGGTFSASNISQQLANAIRGASHAKFMKKEEAAGPPPRKLDRKPVQLLTTHKVLAIGASTGGTKAIEVVLRDLPASTPGTVIVQHMPEGFTRSFADRLNQITEMEVREARDSDYVVPGVALIAPGNYHMVLQRSGARYFVRIVDGPQVHYQRPAVDILFESVAQHAGSNSMGVILTGMGADGAKGMLAMAQRGAYCIAQDEKTSTVFGMPKEAIKTGAVNEVLPLDSIAGRIIDYLSDRQIVSSK